jgi:hypothetical protein
VFDCLVEGKELNRGISETDLKLHDDTLQQFVSVSEHFQGDIYFFS